MSKAWAADDSIYVAAAPKIDDRTLAEAIEDARYFFTPMRIKRWLKAAAFAVVVSIVSSYFAYTLGKVAGQIEGRKNAFWLIQHQAEVLR